MADATVTTTPESSGGTWTETATLNGAPDLTVTGRFQLRPLVPARVIGEWRTSDTGWRLAEVYVVGYIRNEDENLGFGCRIAWRPENSYSAGHSFADAPDYVRAWVAEVEAGLPTIRKDGA